MSAATGMTMLEDEWFKLCGRMCRERRKEYDEDTDYCEEHGGIGCCPECESDAEEFVLRQGQTNDDRLVSVMARLDRLAGGKDVNIDLEESITEAGASVQRPASCGKALTGKPPHAAE